MSATKDAASRDRVAFPPFHHRRPARWTELVVGGGADRGCHVDANPRRTIDAFGVFVEMLVGHVP